MLIYYTTIVVHCGDIKGVGENHASIIIFLDDEGAVMT